MSDDKRAGFLNPAKKCDIVMKGGITSGVVYPATVTTLAATYRFANIGGTSAGAIAAAATAAAEYRRQSNGTGDGFAKLAALPQFLADKPSGSRHTNLFWLFQPDPGGSFLFNLGLSFTKPGWRKAPAFLAALLTGAPVVWLIVVGLGLVYLFHPSFETMRSSDFTDASVVLWLLLLLVVGIVLAVVRALCALPSKGFGLCSGTTQGGKVPALTDWLHGFLCDLAGKPQSEPLTFGDLQTQGIQLRMISTNLTHGRAYGLPIDTDTFYFKPDELAAYFPPSVVRWMTEHPGPESTPREPLDTTGFCRLPHPADLPVVVAARMSLSFPVLFRAVPLYTIDFTLFRHKTQQPGLRREPGGAIQPDERRVPERCWFLDGGISSNFPISMFDAPLPRWPTFGIDLQSVRKDRPDSFVWLPEENEQGLGEQWDRLPDDNWCSALFGYIAGLFNTARNWTDNRQMTVPGYRDRIVHIRLTETEGGLNLDMPNDIVAKVSGRGSEAAQRLLDHFANPNPGVSMTWDNHRWTRFRSLLAQLDDLLTRFQTGYTKPEPGERSYHELLHRGKKEAPGSYRITAKQRALIDEIVERLTAMAALVEGASPEDRATIKAPRPVPMLRLLPRTVPESNVDRAQVALFDPPTEGERSVEDPE